MQDRGIAPQTTDQKNDAIVPIEDLRLMTDYHEAQAAQDYCFIGRNEETKFYTLNYPGRILHPEARGEKWTLEKNMAFMAGAIEARKTFLVVTPLAEIANRAKRGLTGQCFQKIKLGFTTAEILWLEDNGYTFEENKENLKQTWAIPPKETTYPALIKRYGTLDNLDANEQVDRICKIAKIETLGQEQQRRDQDKRQGNPRQSIDSWGRKSGGGRSRRNRDGDTYRFSSSNYQQGKGQRFFNRNPSGSVPSIPPMMRNPIGSVPSTASTTTTTTTTTTTATTASAPSAPPRNRTRIDMALSSARPDGYRRIR